MRDIKTNLESTVCHYGTRELGIEVLLVSHPGPKLLLPEHLPERDVVRVGVNPRHLTRLRIALLDLTKPLSHSRVTHYASYSPLI